MIERACILADGEFITERELAVSMPPCLPVVAAARRRVRRAPIEASRDLLVNVEREHIQRALVRANGNKKAAARMLGLSRRALYRRLERLDLGDTIMRRRETPQETVNRVTPSPDDVDAAPGATDRITTLDERLARHRFSSSTTRTACAS